MRERKDLNFNWLFHPNYQDEHITHFNQIDGFEKVDLPHNAVDIPFNHFNESMIQTECTYKKELMIETGWKNKKIMIIFEGVANIANVFVDDSFVMTHKGGYTRFIADLTEYVEIGKTHMITVVVDSHENVFVPPFGGVVDYLGYSGIYREVSLEIIEPSHIRDVFVKTPNPLTTSTVALDIDTSVTTGYLDIRVFDHDKELIYTKVPITDHHMGVKIDIGQKQLWHINTPYLYHVEVKLFYEDVNVDCITTRFGFRAIEFKEDGFYLNGHKCLLRGLNRHQSYPYVGYAMPKNVQYDDARILKRELGCTIVRTAHYPQSKHFLDACDELGLLVFEEIPGWQHIGNDEWKDLTLKNVKDMILRDRNHPSIILWGVRINESPDDHDLYQKTNEIAHTLDNTRPTGGVRNIAKSEFFEDVYTYNDFSHRGGKKILEKKTAITRAKHPYLVTEYNGHMFPTKRYDDELHRLEHALRHTRILNEAANPKNKMAGCIGWVMNDYNTHQEFGSGDKVCYHGVLDMFRLPKLASAIYASQQEEIDVLEVSSNMNIGDYPAGELSEVYVFTNCDYVKLYKNNEYIKTFYPDFKRFKHLKHPPIIIDDFIGELIEKHENISAKDSIICKDILKAVGKYGNNLPLRYKLKILKILKTYHMSFDDGVKMFFKYISGWGTKQTTYRFDGYIQSEKIKSVIKENNTHFSYQLLPDRKTLTIDQTYDAMRVVVKKVNQHGEIISYSFDPVEINVDGAISLIGPNKIHLQGGIAAFWIKTNGDKGIGTIRITSDAALSETVVVK